MSDLQKCFFIGCSIKWSINTFFVNTQIFQIMPIALNFLVTAEIFIAMHCVGYHVKTKYIDTVIKTEVVLIFVAMVNLCNHSNKC